MPPKKTDDKEQLDDAALKVRGVNILACSCSRNLFRAWSCAFARHRKAPLVAGCRTVALAVQAAALSRIICPSKISNFRMFDGRWDVQLPCARSVTSCAV